MDIEMRSQGKHYGRRREGVGIRVLHRRLPPVGSIAVDGSSAAHRRKHSYTDLWSQGESSNLPKNQRTMREKASTTPELDVQR